jgi:hypothetical protein
VRRGYVLTHAPPSFPSPCPRRDAHILLGCDGLRKSLTVFLQRDLTNRAETLLSRPGIRMVVAASRGAQPRDAPMEADDAPNEGRSVSPS